MSSDCVSRAIIHHNTGENYNGCLHNNVLGEIYVKNEFVPMEEVKDSPAVNVISTGVRNIRPIIHHNTGENYNGCLHNNVKPHT
jgi:hypothetical protein